MNLKRVLIIRFSSIGDIVLCSPVLRNLVRTYPDIQIDVLTKTPFKSLWEAQRHVHRVLTWERKTDTKIWRGESYDVIIDLHQNIRSRWVTCMRWDVPNVGFQKQNLRKFFLVLTKNQRFAAIPLVERYREVLRMLEIPTDSMHLDFSGEASLTAEHAIEGRYIVLVLGASKATKQVPLKKWQEFLEHYPVPKIKVVLIGGSDERKTAQALEKSFPQYIVNRCGILNVLESAQVVKDAVAVVTGDTGLGHIAAAWGKPLIWIWGNTTPEIGMFPPLKSEEHQMIQMQVEGLACRPCSKLGYAECPKKHFKCMDHDPLIWKQNIEKLIVSG